MRFCVTVALLATCVPVDFAHGQEKQQEKKLTYYDWLTLYTTEPLPTFPRGEVLDVFSNNQVLLSFGASHGAKKGSKMQIYRLGPQPMYVGPVELVDVGAKHSIGRIQGRERVRENDWVSWISPIMPKFQVERHVPRPDWWRPSYGEAIIDLARGAPGK